MTNRPLTDPISELQLVLAEGDADDVTPDLRERVLAAAIQTRPAGHSSTEPEWIRGVEVFDRMTSRLDRLLVGLAEEDWRQRAIRELDVQGVIGHLIGVEEDFAATLRGDATASSADHVESTQSRAEAQAGRPPVHTRRDWTRAVRETIELASDPSSDDRPIQFHGIAFPLDSFLVARAFEVWTHDEDIRRATGRRQHDPDPETLARMTDLATLLLPLGVALAGATTDGTVRLVLTGPGGGTWDAPLDGRPVSRAGGEATIGTHVVVDAARFCRVTANRWNLDSSGADVRGDRSLAESLFRGASKLALD